MFTPELQELPWVDCIFRDGLGESAGSGLQCDDKGPQESARSILAELILPANYPSIWWLHMTFTIIVFSTVFLYIHFHPSPSRFHFATLLKNLKSVHRNKRLSFKSTISLKWNLYCLLSALSESAGFLKVLLFRQRHSSYIREFKFFSEIDNSKLGKHSCSLPTPTPPSVSNFCWMNWFHVFLNTAFYLVSR